MRPPQKRPGYGVAALARAHQAFQGKFRELRSRRLYLSACIRLSSPCGHLEEWITFHRRVDIEHFFILYTNDLGLEGLGLAPYRDAPDVTLIEHAPGIPASERMTQTILGLRGTTRWLALPGIRDYLFSPRESDLRRVLVPFEEYGGVVVHPMDFPCEETLGNGPSSLLRATHLRKQKPGSDPGIIVNPHALKRVHEDGSITLKYGRDCIDESMCIGFKRKRFGRTVNLLRINRYLMTPHEPGDSKGGEEHEGLEEDHVILERESGTNSPGRNGMGKGPSTPVERMKRWSRAMILASREARLALPRRHYLSLALMFKDAAPYLREWIEFHRLVGVEHFYLYNNASTDDPESILEPYREAGLITLRDWPAGSTQKACFDHCIAKAAFETRWLGILDDDEFLFPIHEDSLAHLLESYENFAGVGVPWLMFGSSGHRAAPEGFVIENFIRRAVAVNRLRKCIFDPGRVSEFVDVHHLRFKSGYVLVDEDRRLSPGTNCNQETVQHFRLHHYYTKSYEEAKRKVERRGYVNPGASEEPQVKAYLEAAWGDGLNEMEDTSIHRFLPALKEAVARPAEMRSSTQVVTVDPERTVGDGAFHR